MNGIEFFAGSRSIGKITQEKGMQVYSTDNVQYGNINDITDILLFDPENVPFIPDWLWFSPPCTGFSVAALGHHWTGGKNAYVPNTDTARLGIKLAEKCLELIEHYKRKNKDIVWFIENPRGLLRKMPFMADLPMYTVTYCQYGDDRMKPTDIWTNSSNWVPKPICKNGDSCHVAAPRGSKTGTQGLKGAYERSKLPLQLCEEIIESLLITQ